MVCQNERHRSPKLYQPTAKPRSATMVSVMTDETLAPQARWTVGRKVGGLVGARVILTTMPCFDSMISSRRKGQARTTDRGDEDWTSVAMQAIKRTTCSKSQRTDGRASGYRIRPPAEECRCQERGRQCGRRSDRANSEAQKCRSDVTATSYC